MNGWRAIATLGVVAASLASAQLPQAVTIQSRSGQFIIRGLPLSKLASSHSSTSEVSYVRVDPMVMAATMENIKQSLLTALEQTDQWQGRVMVSVRPTRRDNEEIVIASVREGSGWQYRMQLPEQVDKSRLVKALVEVLLLEIAQRDAGHRRVEMPPWLAMGIAAHLTAIAPAPLVAEPETFLMLKAKRRADEAMKQARARLADGAGLSLDQLNWPDDTINPEVYEASAHLFVRELLRRPGGARFMSDLLAQLSEVLNWQTAFLQAYHFSSLREVDKWWTLQLIQFAGKQSPVKWSPSEARGQLDQIVQTAISVRHDANALPLTTYAPLQAILQEWDLARQTPLLQQKIIHLDALRLRAPSGLAELIVEYQKTLSDYITRRPRGTAGKTQTVPSTKQLLTETIRKLDELDARKEAIAPLPPGTPTLSDVNRR